MLVHQSVLKGHHVILVLPLTVVVVVMVGEEGRLKLALSSLYGRWGLAATRVR